MSTDVLATVVLFGSPELGRLAISLFAGLCLGLSQLTCVQTDELEKLVADAVTTAMHLAGLSAKQLAAIMRIDEAQLRRQLRAEPSAHLSLSRLVRAWQLWPWLGPSILYIVAKRRWDEILEVAHRKSA